MLLRMLLSGIGGSLANIPSLTGFSASAPSNLLWVALTVNAYSSGFHMRSNGYVSLDDKEGAIFMFSLSMVPFSLHLIPLSLDMVPFSLHLIPFHCI